MGLGEEFLDIVGLEKLKSTCREANISCSWFLFGSLTRGKVCPNDIDILLVTENLDDAHRVRSLMMDTLSRNPIHLTVMTSKEEQELSFVKHVKARAI